ncbi:uncharacterized protein N7473_004789 [Penicillium subrubescens]|uniref:Uncharacterized protein n=1 Tax=Penicillium subrubescens TaxID=1316194 RepID=A0A1Q5ULL6_9EURO|nr:uncharacterized protein N7473_004789 [Penicillium subrubescens]KAJ5900719.1 hypothetical protein N7473_004789 [Penicillium subrubescens]OKP13349.1 hypothetical protein PENSUB_951 [Penicillium subrubescens]
MAVRRQTGPSYGGGKNGPAYHQEAGSLRPPTNGSGSRNNGWNGHGHSNVRYQNQYHNNRSHNFNPHHHNNFGGQSQVHPQKVNFRQYNPHHRQNRNFQNRQGGGFNGPNHGQNFHDVSCENPVPSHNGFQDQLHPPLPRGPKNRRRRNRQFEENLYNAVHDIEMVDNVNTFDLDTDIDMPDAPPLECYQQNLIVAEGIAAANALLSRIEYFVRTGTIPVEM